MLTGDSLDSAAQRGSLISRLQRAKTGAAATEFALMLPLLLLIVAGALQYGTMLYTYNSMVNGARSAARALSLGDTSTTDVQAAVKAWMPNWVPGDSVTVTTENVGTDRVRVDVSIPATDSAVFRIAPMPETLDASILMMLEE